MLGSQATRVLFTWIDGRVEFCSLWVTNQRKGGLLTSRMSSLSLFRSRVIESSAAELHCCKFAPVPYVVNHFLFWWRWKAWICIAKFTNKKCSRVLDSLHRNTSNKTIRIHWKPTFHNITFSTTVCSVSLLPCSPLPLHYFQATAHVIGASLSRQF
jgi:hypothetical protein